MELFVWILIIVFFLLTAVLIIVGLSDRKKDKSKNARRKFILGLITACITILGLLVQLLGLFKQKSQEAISVDVQGDGNKIITSGSGSAISVEGDDNYVAGRDITNYFLSKDNTFLFVDRNNLQKPELILFTLDEATHDQNVAIMYLDQGNYKEAQHYYENALQIRQALKGSSDKETGKLFNNIGAIYLLMCQYDNAIECFNNAYVALSNHFQVENEIFSQISCNIASAYIYKGLFTKAQDLLKTIEEKVDKNNKNLLSIIESNRAHVEYELWNLKDSLKLYKNVLQSRKEQFGDDAIILTYANLGVVYEALNDLKKAREYYEIALALSEHNCGIDNPASATILNNAAIVYFQLGEKDKSIEALNTALRIREFAYGYDHVQVAIVLDNLGYIYQKMGNNDATRKLYNRALDIVREKCKNEYISCTTAYINMATFLSSQGDYETAKDLLNEILLYDQKIYGENHPDIVGIYHNYAVIYNELKDLPYSLRYSEMALLAADNIWGPDHPLTATIMNTMGLTYYYLDNYPKSKEVLELAEDILLDFADESIDKDETLSAIYGNLALVFEGEKNYGLAEEYYLRSISMKKALYDEFTPSLAPTYYNLAGMYLLLGRNGEAKQYFGLALEIFKRSVPSNPYIEKIENILNKLA